MKRDLLGFTGILRDCARSFKGLRGIGRACQGGSARTKIIANPPVRGADSGRKTSIQGRFRNCEPALKSGVFRARNPITPGRATTSRSAMVTAPGPRPEPGTARAGARPRGAVAPRSVAADNLSVSELTAFSAELGSRPVGSVRIADGTITTAKIADTTQCDRFGMGRRRWRVPARVRRVPRCHPAPAPDQQRHLRSRRACGALHRPDGSRRRRPRQRRHPCQHLRSARHPLRRPGHLRFLPPTIAKRMENMARHRRRQPWKRFPRGFSGSGAGRDHPRSNATACQRGC